MPTSRPSVKGVPSLPDLVQIAKPKVWGERVRTEATSYYHKLKLRCCSEEEYVRWFRDCVSCNPAIACRTLDRFCIGCHPRDRAYFTQRGECVRADRT
jgi:hypothetical protein